jgi:hypothetical protein
MRDCFGECGSKKLPCVGFVVFASAELRCSTSLEPVASHRHVDVGTYVARLISSARLFDDVSGDGVVIVARDQRSIDAKRCGDRKSASKGSEAESSASKLGEKSVPDVPTLLEQEVVQRVANGEADRDATTE